MAHVSPNARGRRLSFPVTYTNSPSCLWGYVSSSPLGACKGPILSFPID